MGRLDRSLKFLIKSVALQRDNIAGLRSNGPSSIVGQRIEKQRNLAAVRRATSAIWKASAIMASELVMRPRPLEFADVVEQSVALAPIKVGRRRQDARQLGPEEP